MSRGPRLGSLASLASLALLAACVGGELDASGDALAGGGGAGGLVCELPNAEKLPDACGIARCEGDHADCNGKAADGCEADLLTSAASCGACGNACASGASGACARGSCSPLAVVSDEPAGTTVRDLVAIGTGVAWLRVEGAEAGDFRAATVMVAAGGAPVGRGEIGVPRGALGHGGLLAADGDALLVGDPRAGTIAELRADGSSHVVASGLGALDALALVPFVPGAGARVVARSGGSLVAVDRASGAVTSLASVEPAAHGCRIAADPTHAYWTEPDAWLVRRVPLAGGPAEVYAEHQRMACGVAVADGIVAWISVDPTLSVYLTRFSATSIPPSDYIPGASAAVGYYAARTIDWDLAMTAEGDVVVANAHDGDVFGVPRGAVPSTRVAGRQARLGGAATSKGAAFWSTSSQIVRAPH